MPALRFRPANEKEYCEPYCELQAGRAAGACGADGGLVEFFRSRGWNSQPCALSLLDFSHIRTARVCARLRTCGASMCTMVSRAAELRMRLRVR